MLLGQIRKLLRISFEKRDNNFPPYFRVEFGRAGPQLQRPAEGDEIRPSLFGFLGFLVLLVVLVHVGIPMSLPP